MLYHQQRANKLSSTAFPSPAREIQDGGGSLQEYPEIKRRLYGLDVHPRLHEIIRTDSQEGLVNFGK